MSESKKKKKFPWQSIVMIAVFLGASFGAGWFIGSVMDPVLDKMSKGELITSLVVIYISFILSYFLQVVIHEGGHLVFGLLTGYKYSSFRIGSFMWVKLDGKMKLKRLSVAGTGGQCLMAPPDLVDGKVLYVLYNFGGAIANVLFSVVPLVFAFVFGEFSLVTGVIIVWAAIGLFFALMNGIPMKMQGMPNDGHNALSLGKHPEAMKAFWLQMKINEQIALGKRLKDLPEEWFELPSKDGMKNTLIATIPVFACNRLMDMQKYEEADELMERLLAEKSGMVGVHVQILKADRVFCEMVGENRLEKVEELYDEELKKFLKAMRKSPSTYRVEYLYSKYIEKDEKKAAAAMAGFEKVAKTYPYPHEIEGEREMIAYAEERLSK